MFTQIIHCKMKETSDVLIDWIDGKFNAVGENNWFCTSVFLKEHNNIV